jgi:hypothetical protein
LDLNNKSFKDKINDLTKKLDRVDDSEEEYETKGLTEKEQEEEDMARYQASKKAYYFHDGCSSEECVLECPYFPDEGRQTEDGEILYEDPELDPEFYGERNTLETRKKILVMSPVRLERYKQRLKLKYEYTEETKKAIEEGKRLYVRSGCYPAEDDPETIPNAQYYEYKS